MQCVFSDCYGIKLETNNRKKKKKESASQYGRHRNASLTSEWGRFPGGGHGNLLQYSCLENPMDRGAWQATVDMVRVGHD